MKLFLRILLLSLTFLLGFSLLCSCSGGADTTLPEATSTPSEESTESTPDSTAETTPDSSATVTTEEPSVPRPTPEETIALDMLSTFMDQYALSAGVGERAYLNVKEYYGKNDSGFLWSNFSAAGMQYYVCKLYPDDEVQKENY